MSLWVIVAIVLGAVAMACALAVVMVIVSAGWRASLGVEVIPQGGDRFLIRSPYGPGSARLVVHENHGRVYEVRLRFRREPEGVAYVPPTPTLIASFVQREVQDRAMRDAARRRRVARTR